MTALSPPHLAGVTLRAARPDDHPALERLAALDSRRLPSGPLLLAEEDGLLRAALCTTTGATIADPFAPTEHLLALLRRHARRHAGRPSHASRDWRCAPGSAAISAAARTASARP